MWLDVVGVGIGCDNNLIDNNLIDFWKTGQLLEAFYYFDSEAVAFLSLNHHS